MDFIEVALQFAHLACDYVHFVTWKPRRSGVTLIYFLYFIAEGLFECIKPLHTVRMELLGLMLDLTDTSCQGCDLRIGVLALQAAILEHAELRLKSLQTVLDPCFELIAPFSDHLLGYGCSFGLPSAPVVLHLFHDALHLLEVTQKFLHRQLPCHGLFKLEGAHLPTHLALHHSHALFLVSQALGENRKGGPGGFGDAGVSVEGLSVAGGTFKAIFILFWRRSFSSI